MHEPKTHYSELKLKPARFSTDDWTEKNTQGQEKTGKINSVLNACTNKINELFLYIYVTLISRNACEEDLKRTFNAK